MLKHNPFVIQHILLKQHFRRGIFYRAFFLPVSQEPDSLG
jgi:hypothetical protein